MSNLLKDASILLTPTAYENGRMNAIKPSKDLYGPELVTNGDFAIDDNWSKGTGWTISGGKANGSNTTGDLYQENVVAVGKKYKVTYTISNYVSGSIRVELPNNSYDGILRSANGTYTETILSGGTLVLFDARTSFTGSIENVSVKEDLSGDFNFERNSAATRVNAQGLVENVQIISPELVSNGNFSQIGTEEVLNGNFLQEGSELVVNGDFSNGSANWNGTNTNGVTISNGSLNYSDTTLNHNVSQGSVVTIGKSYKVTLTVSNYVKGSVLIIVGAGGALQEVSSNGTFTMFGVASLNTTFYLQTRGTNGTSLSIDNVSVKEVGQNWDLVNDASIGNGVATFLDGGSNLNTQVKQNNILTSGKTYKLTFDVARYVAGQVQVLIGGGATFNVNISNGVGTYTIYGLSDGTNLIIKRSGGYPNFDFDITNISVKEVGQDWTFGTNWSVDQANGKAYADGTSSAPVAQPSLVSVSGAKYKIEYTVSDFSAGKLRVYFGGIFTPFATSNGVYSYVIYSTSSNVFTTSITSTFEGSISNISVKEITDDTNIPRINYEGFSYQDSLGSEEVVNGDFSVDSNWTKGGGWSISGGTANTDGTPSSEIRQNNVTIVGKQYKYSFTISNSGSGVFSARLRNKSTGTPILNFSSEGTYSGTFTSNGTFIDFVTLSNNTASFSIDNVSVKEYLGQEVVPDSGCGSWLLEPQSTNLATKSENISGWSFPTNVTTTQNYGISPDGSVNSTRLQFTANGFMNDALTLTSGTEYTLSIYAKRNDTGTQSFGFYVNGIPTVVGGITLTDEWQRFTYTYTASSNSSIGLAGDSGADVSVFGFQAEAKSYATSYIPTNGATNTRLQDIANNSGNSSLINSTEGVLYAEVSRFANDILNTAISINQNGDFTNSVSIKFRSTENLIFGIIYSSGNISALMQYTLPDDTQFNKIAISYAENNFALWVNGIKVLTDTSGNAPIGLNNLSFNLVTEVFVGKTKALAVYKEALSDAQLQCLTTI